MSDSFTSVISNFSGEYEWLSNFHQRIVVFRSIRWPSAEHAYQAMKSANSLYQERIRLEAPHPRDAKRMGSKVPLRPEWDRRRLPFMKAILDHKFATNSQMAQWLVNTGDTILIEGNTWGGKFWGVCNGEGENHLGILLMNRRQALLDLGMKTVKKM